MKKLLILLTFLFSFTPFIANAAICAANYTSGHQFNLNNGDPNSNGFVYAQPFTVSATCVATSISFQLKKTNSPSDNVNVIFWTGSLSSSPSTQIGSATAISAASLTTSFATTTTSISGITFSSGTQYFVSLSRSGGSDNSNLASVLTDTNVAAWGAQSLTGASWSQVAYDNLPGSIDFELQGSGSSAASFFQTLYGWW